MKTVFIGLMPGVFGYGLSVAGDTGKECREALRDAFYALQKAYQQPWAAARPMTASGRGEFKTFTQAFDHFGGSITEVIKGKTYYDDFKS